MPVIINDIRLRLEDGEQEAIEVALRRLHLKRSDTSACYLVRASVDARHREISFVCSVGVELPDEAAEAAVAAAAGPGAVLRLKPRYDPPVGVECLPHRPVIAGFGPA
ncbi:MAG: hypothetical protein P4M02_01385, partial [Clostridia bacterium]|nr:hypothetical protein [Clostridia bacterium]